MGKATFSVLSESDKALVLEAEPKKLRILGEDELLDLHARVVKTREDNAKVRQRQRSERSETDQGSRSLNKTERQASVRAEVLEETLARVSKRVASVAKANGERLRSERLAAAKNPDAKSKAKAKKAKLKKAKLESKKSSGS